MDMNEAKEEVEDVKKWCIGHDNKQSHRITVALLAIIDEIEQIKVTAGVANTIQRQGGEKLATAIVEVSQLKKKTEDIKAYLVQHRREK